VRHCTQCGHTLGLGRFCTNCGHPVAARHADPLTAPLADPLSGSDPANNPAADPAPGQDWQNETAERPTRATSPAQTRVAPPPAEPRLPPAVVEAPPPPRFPLFADEVVPAEASASAAESGPPPPPALEADPAPAALADEDAEIEDWDEEDWDEEDWEDHRSSRTMWVVAGVALLAVLVVGGWFLGRALGGDDDPAAEPTAGGPADTGEEPTDRTAQATAEAPRTAPSTEDVDGNPTSYDAENMLDGDPETAWRAAGDGSGFKLVFTFPRKTRISEVGLVNGYAKTATDDAGTAFDWYAGHRRIAQVTWNFGVGDLVRQDLKNDPALQTVEVGPVEVRKVVLKIVTTTEPGQGPTRRDFTAISDVFFAG
jgi:hypothetical protein